MTISATRPPRRHDLGELLPLLVGKVEMAEKERGVVRLVFQPENPRI